MPILAQENAGVEKVTLAEQHLSGKIPNASVERAMELLEEAAALGEPRALLRQGEIYLQGINGMEPNPDRALFLFQSAAESGLTAAITRLGAISESKGHAADAKPERQAHFAEAREYYQKAADAGDTQAQIALSTLLGNGDGGDADAIQSLAWLEKAANGGHAIAMNELGRRYQRGEGVKASPVTALGWFLASAERGSTEAMTNLGICYSRGVVVPRNYDQAGNWFAKAAKENFPIAQYYLGELFEKGLGIEAKPVFAYVNYVRAASGGYAPAVEARDKLKSSLNPDQMAEAESMLK
jgi:TPR repeat protein